MYASVNRRKVGPTRNRKSVPRRPNSPQYVNVIMSEELKIIIHSEICGFLESSENALTMPASITKDQRKYIHRYAMKLGLLSRSHGKNENRVLTLYKPIKKTLTGDPLESVLPPAGSSLIQSFINQQTLKIPPKDNSGNVKRLLNPPMNFVVNRLTKQFIPQCPTVSTRTNKDRMALPIYAMRKDILNVINTQQVVIVNGETGSGKSTQLPQYILENANKRQVPCRIICTQPRRIAAISIAERVALERSEELGNTVGYQIRLENKFKHDTKLIFATTGCFLRSLMGDARQTFRGISHIVIDEIHERDINTDFVLIAIREELKWNRDLKVILMSATINTKLLCEYFSACHVIQVPGRIYETRTFFLEDVIFNIDYETAQMRSILEHMQINQDVTAEFVDTPADQLDPDTRLFVNQLIESCCNESQDVADNLEQLIYLIESEGVPVNVRHTVSGCTPLMAAAACNHLEYVKLLLRKGAQADLADEQGKTALAYNQHNAKNSSCLDYLHSAAKPTTAGVLTVDRKILLLAYQQQFPADYEEIDHYLLISLLLKIYKQDCQGSILIFLPGYADIMIQKEMIESAFEPDTYRIFLIHSSMNANEQRMAFKRTNVRKIILSTNIAETSITFPDVVYVIDTGRIKQQVYNSMTGSSCLQLVDISKACAKQRAGRAGRTRSGICYRLYSSAKFESLREYPVAEFLRVPLTEICLYSKVLSCNVGIADYLANAIEPPATTNVTNAIYKLQQIGALDENENLTILGRRLVDAPLDVQFGKCVLYAVFLGCINPVATIAAYFSGKDPFLLFSDRTDRSRVKSIRKDLYENSISDHQGIVRLYQKWRKSRQFGTESNFLAQYNLSKAALDMMQAVQNKIFDYVKSFLPPGVPLSTLNTNSNDWNIIRACLTAGLYPNVAKIDRKKGKIRTQYEKFTTFDINSVLSDSVNRNDRNSYERLPTSWAIFGEGSRIGSRSLIRYNTLVTPLHVILFCGGLKHTNIDTLSDYESENEYGEFANANQGKTLTVGEWIRFNIPTNEYYLLTQFKTLLLDAFVNFLHVGSPRHSGEQSFLIATLKKLLAIDGCKHFGNTGHELSSYLPEIDYAVKNNKSARIGKKML